MFVRTSKFKHIIGKPNKKEFCYDEIRITKSSWDSTFCSVNPKYLAIITEAAGGGAFLVLPIEKNTKLSVVSPHFRYGRVGRDAPLVAGHRAAVLDIEWCPHNDDLIASGSEDCTAKVWQIPEGGLQPETNLTVPVSDLVAHQRRVGLVKWHPTAEYVLLTAGADNMIFIWNVSTEEKLISINFPDMVLSASFNWNGSRLVTTCKDRHTRVLDPRNGSILKDNVCHQGTKPQQAIYLKDGRIFTTGFSPMSERQFAIWAKDDVEKRLVEMDLDISNGIMFPFYDPDSNLLFLCGKGDSSMRYFELTEDDPYIFFIDTMTSSDPQRGIGWMPKRGLNVYQNEIARFYKLHTKGFCEVISFTVPRKSVLYQDDLYPDTVGDVPALSADEWMSGKDADPILMSRFSECCRMTINSNPIPRTVTCFVLWNKKVFMLRAESGLFKFSHLLLSRRANEPTPAVFTLERPKRAHAPLGASQANLTADTYLESDKISLKEAFISGGADGTKGGKKNGKLPPSRPKLAESKLAGGGSSQTASGANTSSGAVADSNRGSSNATGDSGKPVDFGGIAPEEIQQLMDDMRKMKIIIKGHERRIKHLEEQLRDSTAPQAQ
ncbi:hypothetical protein ACTXT7_002146 [Hymenolepis weldensis]